MIQPNPAVNRRRFSCPASFPVVHRAYSEEFFRRIVGVWTTPRGSKMEIKLDGHVYSYSANGSHGKDLGLFRGCYELSTRDLGGKTPDDSELISLIMRLGDKGLEHVARNIMPDIAKWWSHLVLLRTNERGEKELVLTKQVKKIKGEGA